MGFLDKAKAAAEQAAAAAEQAANRAKEGVEDVQAKRDLAAAFGDLGRKAHELATRAEISHPELDPLVQRITQLQSGAGAQADGGGMGMTPEAAAAPGGAAPPPPGASEPAPAPSPPPPGAPPPPPGAPPPGL